MAAAPAPQPVLAVVVSPRTWAQDLHRFVADHGGAHVRLRVLDAREAEHEPYDVLVCEDLTSFLTPHLVDRLHAQGKRVLGLHDAGEPRGADVLRDLGADEVLTIDRPPADVVAAASGLLAERRLGTAVDGMGGRGGPWVDAPGVAAEGTRPPSNEEATGPVGADRPDQRAPDRRRRGHVLAVGGPTGGVGATEVALALAARAAARGERVVVVDGDEVAPALAQRVAAAPHPNVRSAVDAVRTLRGHVRAHLQPVAAVPGLEMLAGLPNVAAWRDVRPGDVVDVVLALAEQCDRVVVNVGSRLDDLGERRRGHGRHAQTRALVAAADDLVAVALPTPVGITRLLDWIATARTIATGSVDVAINRCPRRGFVAAEVDAEVRRSWSPSTLVLLPDDARVAGAAWAGTVDGSRRWWRAVDELAHGVLRGPVVDAPVDDGDDETSPTPLLAVALRDVA